MTISLPASGRTDSADGSDSVPAGRTAAPGRVRTATVLISLTLVGVVVVVMSPVIWTAMAATKPTVDAFASPPRFLYRPSLDAFVDLWQSTDFYQYLINTAVVAAISVVVTMLIATPAAYALSRYGGRTSAAILAVALIFRAIPSFAIVLPFYRLSTQFDIYDTRIALALAFVAVDQPFTIWLLRNFFAEIPRDLDDAALIDGCSRWGVLRRVMLPVMTPGLVTAGIFTFLIAFQEYTIPLVLTDVDAKTVPVFLTSQLGQTLPMLQQASAGVVLLTLPIVALAFVAQRYLVSGWTSGAVKG